MKYVVKLLPHLCMILSAVLITLLILDYYNPNMDFYDNQTTRIMFGILCAAAIASGIIIVIIDRKAAKNTQNKKINK